MPSGRNVWYEAHIYQLARQICRNKAIFEKDGVQNRLIETPNVIFREKHNLAATYHYAARLWQVLIYSLFIYKVE